MSRLNPKNMNSGDCLNNLVNFGDSNYQPLKDVLKSLEGLLPPEIVSRKDPDPKSVSKIVVSGSASGVFVLPSGYCYEVLSQTLADGSKQDVFPSYSLGLSALQDACNSELDCKHPYILMADKKKLYVPLTFSQTCAARLLQPELLDKWFDTSSGVLYKSEGENVSVKRIKVILFCEQLYTLQSLFNNPYLSMNYDSVLVDGENVFELLVDDTYNCYLEKTVALEHKGLLVAFDNNYVVLEKFCNKVYECGKQTGFFVLEKVGEDQLRAWRVGDDYWSSSLSGDNSLSLNTRFLRVARQKNIP